MADAGLDYSWARPPVSVLKAYGIKFVCRYLSWPSGKVITKSEYDSYVRNGIEVFLNWEFQAKDGQGGAYAGRIHAQEAVRQAKNLGYPRGATIYFSIADFDVFGTNSVAACDAYALAALTVLRAAGYRFGVYGSGRYLSHLRSIGRLDDGWQSPSTFSRDRVVYDAKNAVWQHNLGTNFHGYEVDLNTRHGTTYSSSYRPPIVPKPPAPPVVAPKPPVPPVVTEGDVELTKDERAAVLTAQAFAYAAAAGADTYWLYPPDGGPRKSVSMANYWAKIAKVVNGK
jgi:glycoside hydrolase-like protein